MAASVAQHPVVGALIWIAWALLVAIGVWSLIGGVGILILAACGVAAVVLIRRNIPGWIYGVTSLAVFSALVWLNGL